MSVRVEDRKKSTMEYVNKAHVLFETLIPYLVKIRKRYADIFSPVLIEDLTILTRECEMANTIYPTNSITKQQRLYHLREALGALRSFIAHATVLHKLVTAYYNESFTGIRQKQEKGIDLTKEEQDDYNTIEKVAKGIKRVSEVMDEEELLLKGIIRATQEKAIPNETPADIELAEEVMKLKDTIV